MISFIVIGKNESDYLKLCFNSIIKTIETNGIKDFEIIFVDSNSQDNSVDIALSYPNVRIFNLTKNEKASSGRNIGAKMSRGDILFFIDGDMEIVSDFLPHVIKDNKLVFPFITGEFVYINYNYKGKFINEEKYHSNKKNDLESSTHTNGCFLIERDTWNSVNGMDTKLFVSEDIDLVYRLMKNGINLYRIKKQLGIHHTISAKSIKRSYVDLWNGRNNRFKAVFLRKHLLYKPCLIDFLRSDYTLIIAVLSLAASFIFDYRIIMAYPLSIIIRLLIRDKFNIITLFPFLIYFVLRDFSLLFCLLVNFPSTKTEEYSVIRDF